MDLVSPGCCEGSAVQVRDSRDIPWVEGLSGSPPQESHMAIC